MKQTDPLIWKSTMTTGAFLGLALIVYSIIIYFIDFTKIDTLIFVIIGITPYIVITTGIVYGTKSYRNNYLNGSISYADALKTGTYVVLFAGIIYSFYNYIFDSAIDPGYAQRNAQIIINKWAEMRQQQGVSAQQIASELKSMNPKDIPTAFESSIMGVLFYTFLGFIISLITSAFLKKENNSIITNSK